MATRILICGAGIAGPALACLLSRPGFEVTVVERAPALREGGQAVDFRGPVHREVLERMGLWEPIHRLRTPGTEVVLLDRDGAPMARLPAVMVSGDVEILRGDLSRLLFERAATSATWRFGDHLTGLTQGEAGVTVQFAHGGTELYDLVVGADGLHSGVRALAFGEESRFLGQHGYRVATYTLPNVFKLRGSHWFSLPGRAATVTCENDERARATFVFTGGPLGEGRGDLAGMKQLLRDRYSDVGWEVPRLLAGLERATDLYIDEIGSITIDRYATGRVVLLGDAAYGGTLGGQGTSLAIVGAFVLAGELIAAGGDHAAAFARYEALLRPYATECQKGAKRVGPFYAPRTRMGLIARDLMYRALTSRLLIGQFEKMVKAAASAFTLPEYVFRSPFPCASGERAG